MPAPRNEDVPEDGDALRRDLDELARLRIPGDELRDEEAGGDVEVGGSARVIEPFGPRGSTVSGRQWSRFGVSSSRG